MISLCDAILWGQPKVKKVSVLHYSIDRYIDIDNEYYT